MTESTVAAYVSAVRCVAKNHDVVAETTVESTEVVSPDASEPWTVDLEVDIGSCPTQGFVVSVHPEQDSIDEIQLMADFCFETVAGENRHTPVAADVKEPAVPRLDTR